MKNLPKSHPKIPPAKTGVLLINLGTPDGLGYWQLRRYLKEFLSDPRVVEMARPVWWFVLNVILLSFIPFRSRKNYRPIWDHKKNESPLLKITRNQAKKLQTKLGASTNVQFAMRYGNPAVRPVLHNMVKNGVTNLVVLPLYPQYSAVTTASTMDAIAKALHPLRFQPALRQITPYYDHPAYINALATSVQNHLKKLNWQPDVILASYHGIPVRYFKNGDPYHCHCQKTTRLLAQALNLPQGTLRTTFQSQFGREEWLQPYTEPTLEELAKQGVKNVAVITPGFAADCVETLGEIEIEAKEAFLAAGGKNFTYIPCLNDSEEGIALLEKLVK